MPELRRISNRGESPKPSLLAQACEEILGLTRLVVHARHRAAAADRRVAALESRLAQSESRLAALESGQATARRLILPSGGG